VTDPLTIDGFGPLPVRRPASATDLGDLVRETAGKGEGVYPFGGGTVLDLGLPPIKPGVAADVRGLDQVLDYPARDLTVTVGAGITVGELQETLAAEGQRLPVDVPNPDAATLGGALAANLSGPRRLGRGTLRDSVIGIGFVTDEGHEVQGGGRVVKNVAGYDLMKLHIGALGTLGVITRVTLKVTPRPEEQALVAFGLNAAPVGPTLDRLHASASRPVAVELLNAAAARATGIQLPDSDPWVIVAGFEEKAATVAWQVSTLKDELKAAPVRDVTEFRGPACEPVWAALTQLQAREQSRFVWKANVLPSRVAEFVGRVTMQTPYLIHAHAQNGIVWLHAPDEFDPSAGSALSWMDQCSTHGGGTQVVRRCPPEWKRTLRVWGRPVGDRELMRAVKQALDPKNVFNPGRLFGDL
jgi:glycolate oxidase FAD binding subunit